MTVGRERRHVLPALFIFLLLGLFAVMSTLLVLYAAQVYNATVDRSQANNISRIIRSFAAGTVRTGDSEGTVSVEKYRFEAEDGTPDEIYVLVQRFDGEEGFARRLYCTDGTLWETVSNADRPFHPLDGETQDRQALCGAKHFYAHITGEGLLEAVFAGTDGASYRVKIALRTQSAAGKPNQY